MMRISIWMQRATTVILIVGCALALGASATAILVVRSGYQVLAMQTSSMAPHIEPGDLVVVRNVSPASIEPGDVITFNAPIGSPRIVTHRVVAMDESAGQFAFVTRGDGNAADDPWSIRYVDSGWKHRYTIPRLGHLLTLPQSVTGRAIGLVTVFFTTLVCLWPIIVHRPDLIPVAIAPSAPERIFVRPL